MTRFLLVVSFVVMAAASAFAQGQDACARDASRFCRAYINEGDMVVLACLKQHRARLSKACQQTLASHGQ